MVSGNQGGQHSVTLHLAITATLCELSKIWSVACGFPWNRKLLLCLMQVGPLPLVQDTANYHTRWQIHGFLLLDLSEEKVNIFSKSQKSHVSFVFSSCLLTASGLQTLLCIWKASSHEETETVSGRRWNSGVSHASKRPHWRRKMLPITTSFTWENWNRDSCSLQIWE